MEEKFYCEGCGKQIEFSLLGEKHRIIMLNRHKTEDGGYCCKQCLENNIYQTCWKCGYNIKKENIITIKKYENTLTYTYPYCKTCCPI